VNVLVRASLIATLFSVIASTAVSQQRVHALSGTVKAVYPKVSLTQIATDDGSDGHFNWAAKSAGPVDFDKSVSADAIAADKFTTLEAHVIVYYFGGNDLRTIVSLRDLGAGPFTNTSGAIVKFNKHDHLLTIKNAEGAEETLHLDPKTVADTATGVAQNYKFDFSKGDRVRIMAATSNGAVTALLITPLI
jgi:hypothetical protein